MRNIQHQSCTVIPPHILRHVADHGDDKAREQVTATLRHTARIADDRSQALIETPDAAAALPAKRRLIYDARHRQTLPGKLVMDEIHRPASVRLGFHQDRRPRPTARLRARRLRTVRPSSR